MSFLSMIGAISQREHDRIVARADAVIDSASAHLDAEEFNEGRTLPQKVAIAVRRLAEARSNAFKNRQRYLTAEAKLAEVSAEIAHWKKHGQLRDPATGRLIPKAKASDTFTASHTPA